MAVCDEQAGRSPGDLGGRMRELRRRNNITLREVADAAGVSESFVSQVERGVANPSMASLRRMAEALGESVASLFVGSEMPGMVVRAGDRKRLAHPAGSLDDYLLTPPGAKTLQIIYSVVAPGDGSGEEPYTHPADEECVIVIVGQLVVIAGGGVPPRGGRLPAPGPPSAAQLPQPRAGAGPLDLGDEPTDVLTAGPVSASTATTG
ncbi:helix-turn-helix domain-containing protein [Pseudonocardia sp. T1-2H]|uniref:helix-turn-helix domain-containing protein n=1 Tax=Pseudonocardia sp. T1-2H TaxID=3128899 RepID=UPI003100E9F4